MKLIRCDICDQVQDNELEVRELSDAYRSPGLEHICCDCDNALAEEWKNRVRKTQEAMREWLLEKQRETRGSTA